MSGEWVEGDGFFAESCRNLIYYSEFCLYLLISHSWIILAVDWLGEKRYGHSFEGIGISWSCRH